jgi:hypothetical protein
MNQNSYNDDRQIQMVQSSTRSLLGSFRNKTELLTKYSNDIKLLLREGYDAKIAMNTAEKFFGKKRISFIAIDGTQSQDQQLDMLIFYAGAFGYIGQLEFIENGCSCEEISEANNITNISAAIPIHEEDASNIVGEMTEGGPEVDPERLPSTLMQFAEYYMAVKTLNENPDLKLVILDRTLAGEAGHLSWSVNELLNERRCILQGIDTEFGTVSALDLELSRVLHPNEKLQIPAARSQLIKYAAIDKLTSFLKDGPKFLQYEELLNKIGAKQDNVRKLMDDLTRFNELFSFLSKEDLASNRVVMKPGIEQYWQRVLSAVMKVASHIFDTPSDRHPLMYEPLSDTDHGTRSKKWITSADLEYMTLIMIYTLVRLAWEKNVLVIGLIKDTTAAELTKTIIPILCTAHKIDIVATGNLPNFNTDKQLLQAFSVINACSVKAPWRTFEFDSCFRTIAPIINSENSPSKDNQASVRGTFKNVVSAERLFVKSYVQLWQSQNDYTVRSHVFSYDRPCYPGMDVQGELILNHLDGKVEEQIQPMIHFDRDCEISHLVMAILCSMALEVVPEALGHNYPLFLADKKAKCVLSEMKTSYLSAVAFEMANSEFDQQVLYEERFRDFRSRIETSRTAKS